MPGKEPRARGDAFSPKDLSLIFLGFLLPLAIYLLIVANLNNREHPLMVSGSWDFVGVLFATSGFLLLGGPAILSNFSERARLFWILGDRQGLPAAEDATLKLWFYLALLYPAMVVGWSAYLL